GRTGGARPARRASRACGAEPGRSSQHAVSTAQARSPVDLKPALEAKGSSPAMTRVNADGDISVQTCRLSWRDAVRAWPLVGFSAMPAGDPLMFDASTGPESGPRSARQLETIRVRMP